jgi:hypothetical protein
MLINKDDYYLSLYCYLSHHLKKLPGAKKWYLITVSMRMGFRYKISGVFPLPPDEP